MRTRHYVNLDVTFSRSGDGDGFLARISDSPAGTVGPMAVLIDRGDPALELLALKLDPSRTAFRRVANPTTAVAEELGGMLFHAVFRDEALAALRTSADRHPEALRIRLKLEQTPELATLPWELMFDPGRFKFLAMSERTPVVRFLATDQSAPAVRVREGLRILIIASQPVGRTALNVDREVAAIREVLAAYTAAGVITVDQLPRPTLSDLREWLRNHDVNVLHFIGHGGWDPDREDGVLYFTDEYGYEKKVHPDKLGPFLHDHDPLQLVVLNACDSAQGAGDDRFAGMAQGLIERGVPAVVAMQRPVSDGAAVRFAGDFYASLAAGQPVDQAVSGSRIALQDDFDTEWSTPVLFLSTDDARLFEFPTDAARMAAELPAPRAAPMDGRGTEAAVVPGRAGPPAAKTPQASELLPPPGRPEPPRGEPVTAPAIPHTRAARRRRPAVAVIAALVAIGAVAVVVLVIALARQHKPPSGPTHTTATAAVPANVYNVIVDRGVQILRRQGFTHVRTEPVCSNSVAPGRIRQVILDNNAPLGQETEVVGENGPVGGARLLSTKLAVKESTGPC